MRHQAVYGVLLLRDGCLRTILRPEGFGSGQRFGFFDDTFRFGEGFIGFLGRKERITTVIRHPTGKDTILPFGQFEFYGDTFMVEQTGTVFCPLKFLFKQHIIDKIQIDLLREVKHGTFDKVGRIERDIQVPVKTERFGIKGSESKVRTGFTADLQSIHQIIFVESCPDAG